MTLLSPDTVVHREVDHPVTHQLGPLVQILQHLPRDQGTEGRNQSLPEGSHPEAVQDPLGVQGEAQGHQVGVRSPPGGAQDHQKLLRATHHVTPRLPSPVTRLKLVKLQMQGTQPQMQFQDQVIYLALLRALLTGLEIII